MCESNDDRLSLITDVLNDMSPFDNVEFNAVREFEDWGDEDFYFSVEVVMDSSEFHKVSPNYNENYSQFIYKINEFVLKIVDKYLPPNYKYEISVFHHKNVDTVIRAAKPLLDNAFKVYNKEENLPILPYEFITTIYGPEIQILVKDDVENGLHFKHTTFLRTLSSLYPNTTSQSFVFDIGLFNDFYITSIDTNDPKFKRYNVSESMVDGNVICDNCGWSWELSDGGNDPYTCHKCGQDNLDS